MTKPLTAEQKTLEILRGNYPYTTETLPMEYYTEICEGSESTAELLRDMLTPIKEKSYFCQEWVTYISGFDGDLVRLNGNATTTDGLGIYGTMSLGP